MLERICVVLDAGGGLPPGGPFAAIETSIAQLAHDQAPLLPGALSATYESLALLYRRETEPPLDTQTSARVAGCLSSRRCDVPAESISRLNQIIKWL